MDCNGKGMPWAEGQEPRDGPVNDAEAATEALLAASLENSGRYPGQEGSA